MSRTSTTKVLLVLIGGLLAMAQAQTFTLLHSFSGATGKDGAAPAYGSLAQGFNGNLYGTTTQGGVSCSFFGAAGCGEVFEITPGGLITAQYSFCPVGSCLDGNRPEGGLALNTNGNLYGMTDLGGSVGAGVVFKITPGVTLTTLQSLGADPKNEASFPLTTLIRASNGSFYGITNSGGTLGDGAFIKVTAAGILTVLHSMDSADGLAQGDTGALVQGTDGNFYGVNNTGGKGTVGTVFRLTPGGVLTVLHNFSGSPDGSQPGGALVLGSDGNFYGTTRAGGGNNNNNGTVFKITPTGKLTILYSFCTVNGCPDGFDPVGGLVLGTDGNFYGTTLGGGTGGAPGTVFKITPGGTLTTLHNFKGIADGAEPFAGLVQHTNGTFYGTTNAGGANGLGSVFSISVGLGPFAELVSTSGKVKDTVVILGDGLTGTSKVNFGAASASFVVVSDTQINAAVPAGATTDFVKVTTPSGTLTSNKKFRVIPQITSFNPTSGPVGSMVTITGVSLKQATSVTFNGKSASFAVNSDTQITATVPVGATTGKIKVTTPGGSVTSVATFTVT